jgi:hypothetical protein
MRRGDLHQLVLRREVDQPLDEVEAHAAHAGGVQACSSASVTLRLTVATPRALPFDCDAGVDHRAVVGAVAGGLHDHVAREAEVVAQREELLLAGVAGRVLALGREGEFGAGAEHVAVRVDAAGRQLERGLGWGRRTSPASRGSSRNSSSGLGSFTCREDAVGLGAPVGAAREFRSCPWHPNSPASARSATQAWRSAVPLAPGREPASRTVSATSRTSSLRRRPCSMTRWKK